ncbi:MAG TPA: lysine--tRNA ligase [Candidatus Binataceae bacterium]|jgi:lysyl-tRNA synthetase class 1|nr:lysine--tRNA ligase [Candidatus Binataceae bacterium]
MASAERAELDLWPYQEARRLAERVGNYPPDREVILESGFGPSGLPHLGTMGEVLRPAYVQHAFNVLAASLAGSDPGNAAYRRPSRLIVFIDDMDGLRKVPESVPNREPTARYLGQPVSRIPDPFGDCHPSFAAHMIALLEKFLEPVEVSYELMRSSEMYEGGRFDDALKLILAKHDEIIRIVTPTLREENRAGWSPLMPLCPACGQINSTLVTAYHPERATVEFSCERSFGGSHGCGFRGEQSVLGGKAKVQWKVDWALRWYVLGVDYELYGKDLIDSARLSGQILRLLGGRPPLGFPFEMYLDEEGHKVSKSIGRGVGVEQWRRYAPIEVLKYFLILNPRRARKLFLESIPQYTDEYLDALREWSATEEGARRNSPLEFVLQSQSARRFNSTLSFGLVMNLVAALGSGERELIWRYLVHYDPAIEGDADTMKMTQELMECALNFYRDFIEPAKRHYAPNDGECEQLRALNAWLAQNREAGAEEIEKAIYELGRQYYDKPGKIFSLLYRVILGQERGPRLGAFIRLTTPARVAEIVAGALN